MEIEAILSMRICNVSHEEGEEKDIYMGRISLKYVVYL